MDKHGEQVQLNLIFDQNNKRGLPVKMAVHHIGVTCIALTLRPRLRFVQRFKLEPLNVTISSSQLFRHTQNKLNLLN